MTFAGAGVAAPDTIEGIGCAEREPVGAGKDPFATRERGGGTFLTSTEVTSPASTCRGAGGITRKLVTGSCANFGRDFRLLIGRGDALQNNRQRARYVAL